MLRKNTMLALLIVFATLVVYFINQRKEAVLQHGTSTVYSDSAFGFHIFEHWANRVSPGIVQIERKVFDPTTLQADQVLFIFSPTRAIKTREATDIVDFVKRGGILFVSYEDRDQYEQFGPLLSLLGTTERFNTVPADFSNGQTLELSPARDSRFFKKGESYSIYSSQRFVQGDCDKDRFACYVFEQPLEKGHVVVTLGLPPISNAMISRADNRQVAFRLVSQERGLRFDEFHHFYSDYNFWTLMTKPGFGLPFIAMVLCVLLFFLFGRGSGAQNSATAKGRREVPSYHDLNLSILQGTWTQGVLDRSAPRQHRAFLEKLFPFAKTEIGGGPTVIAGSDWRVEGFRLIRLHRELIEQKRILRKVT